MTELERFHKRNSEQIEKMSKNNDMAQLTKAWFEKQTVLNTVITSVGYRDPDLNIRKTLCNTGTDLENKTRLNC